MYFCYIHSYCTANGGETIYLLILAWINAVTLVSRPAARVAPCPIPPAAALCHGQCLG